MTYFSNRDSYCRLHIHFGCSEFPCQFYPLLWIFIDIQICKGIRVGTGRQFCIYIAKMHVQPHSCDVGLLISFGDHHRIIKYLLINSNPKFVKILAIASNKMQLERSKCNSVHYITFIIENLWSSRQKRLKKRSSSSSR